MNKLYTSLFYTPGTSYTPHTSPLHSLSLSQPERIHLFSLASPAGGEGQKGEVLVYNLLVLKGMREREWFRGRVWSGALARLRGRGRGGERSLTRWGEEQAQS